MKVRDLFLQVIIISLVQSCIDLLLTNQKYSFKNINAFECGHSDQSSFVHLLKAEKKKNELKRLVYRDHTTFSKDSFLTDLSNSIENSHWYEAFETRLFEILDKHAKNKIAKREPFYETINLFPKLRKWIMKRSQLKRIATKTGKDIDLYKFREQINLVVNLNKRKKEKFLKSKQ